MIKKCVLVGVILSTFLLVVGCGIAQEDYDTVVAERDATQAQITSLQSDLSQAQSDLTTAEDNLAETESDLNQAQSDLTTMEDNLTETESYLNQVENKLQAIDTEAVHLARNAEFLSEVNALIETDWPTPEDSIFAWEDIKQSAEEINPAMLPHITDMCYERQHLIDLIAESPPETATPEEAVMWMSEALGIMADYIVYYEYFEVELHSGTIQNIDSLILSLAIPLPSR